jgi:hypothetical protein
MLYTIDPKLIYKPRDNEINSESLKTCNKSSLLFFTTPLTAEGGRLHLQKFDNRLYVYHLLIVIVCATMQVYIIGNNLSNISFSFFFFLAFGIY